MSLDTLTIVSVISILASFAPGDTSLAGETEPPKTFEQIIESYVQDFRSDRFAGQPVLFGIKVPEAGEWPVRVTGEQSDDGWQVELGEGPAPTPTLCYKIEADTLRAIDQGELNALTAQGKALASDDTPMSVIQTTQRFRRARPGGSTTEDI